MPRDYRAAVARARRPRGRDPARVYLFGEVLDGRNESLADGVRQALGREPRDFADYARETAATGVWNS